MSVSQNANGWTVVTPSGDSRLIYVSSSEGDDANDGLSEANPKQTLADALDVMRDGYPDHLYLKRGDSWTEQIVGGSGSFGQGGRSATEPAVISSYGTGARPKISTTTLDGVKMVGTRNYVYVLDLHLDGTGRTGTQSGIGINTVGRGGNLLYENCLIDSYKSGIVFDKASSEDTWGNVTARRNTIVNCWSKNSHSQGLFADNCDGLLLEDNFYDSNGWNDAESDPPSQYNHNQYLSHGNRNVTIIDNISSRGSSSGLKFQPAAGTHTVSGNVFTGNDFGMTIGGGVPQDYPPITGANYTVTHNIVIEGAAKVASANSYGVLMTNIAGGTFSGNIIANKTVDNDGFAVAIMDGRNSWETRGYGVRDWDIDSNTIYNWRGQVQVLDESTADPYTGEIDGVLFRRNLIQEPDAGHDVPLIRLDAFATDDGVVSTSENKYYSLQATPFDIDDTLQSFATWLTNKTDSGSTFEEVELVDPTRTAASYAVHLGYEDYDAFVAAAKLQERDNWNDDLTAPAMASWIRAGFAEVGAEASGTGTKVVTRIVAGGAAGR